MLYFSCHSMIKSPTKFYHEKKNISANIYGTISGSTQRKDYQTDDFFLCRNRDCCNDFDQS